MKFFGRKSAGRDGSRPVLSRGFGAWGGAAPQGEWPSTYEPQVQGGFIGKASVRNAVIGWVVRAMLALVLIGVAMKLGLTDLVRG